MVIKDNLKPYKKNYIDVWYYAIKRFNAIINYQILFSKSLIARIYRYIKYNTFIHMYQRYIDNRLFGVYTQWRNCVKGTRDLWREINVLAPSYPPLTITFSLSFFLFMAESDEWPCEGLQASPRLTSPSKEAWAHKTESNIAISIHAHSVYRENFYVPPPLSLSFSTFYNLKFIYIYFFSSVCLFLFFSCSSSQCFMV